MSKAQVFAFRVKRLREAEHMTQEQLGAATGYSQQQVARWEAGKYLPLTEALVALIATQATAHPATQGRYQARIDAMGEQLDALNRRASALEGQSQRQDRALAGAKQGLASIGGVWERFWLLPEPEINQLLHRLMGNARFVVRDRQIVGIVMR